MVLLIAIRPSDGDVKPGGPLDAFREEQAGYEPAPGFTFSLPYIIISHNTITLHKHVTHTVALTSTSYSTLYRYLSHT